MRDSRKRSTLSMKLLQWSWMWKPRIELPSRPSRICSRHGQTLNTSEFGHGICQKVMIIASGSFSRISRGSSAK